MPMGVVFLQAVLDGFTGAGLLGRLEPPGNSTDRRCYKFAITGLFLGFLSALGVIAGYVALAIHDQDRIAIAGLLGVGTLVVVTRFWIRRVR